MTNELKPAGTTANRWAGYLLIAIAALHTVVFVFHPYWHQWLTGGLWSGGPEESVIFFWALPGSFVPVLILFGLFIVHMARQGVRVPGYAGWVLGAWSIICVALIGPSGFILALAPAGLLIAANIKARKAAA